MAEPQQAQCFEVMWNTRTKRRYEAAWKSRFCAKRQDAGFITFPKNPASPSLARKVPVSEKETEQTSPKVGEQKQSGARSMSAAGPKHGWCTATRSSTHQLQSRLGWKCCRGEEQMERQRQSGIKAGNSAKSLHQ